MTATTQQHTLFNR